jgi:hypothetical protein
MAATGRYEDAARLLAAMEAERVAYGFEPRPCEKVVLKRWRGFVREALEDEVLERISQEGRAFSMDQAAALARG